MEELKELIKSMEEYSEYLKEEDNKRTKKVNEEAILWFDTAITFVKEYLL